MNMKKIFIYLLPALLALSCTTSPDYVVDKGDKGDKVEVCFGQNINIGSRISIGDNGSASWTKGDKIALWAQKSDGSFEMANQTFSLHHFSSTFDTAIFSSLITPLTEQSYTYYATYPVPVSVDGNIARFNLPAIQNGGSELGVRDIMVARPATGAALTEDEYTNLNLGFTHKMHTLRIKLSDNKLNGEEITDLALYFPTNVAGDVLVDITDPNASPELINGMDFINIKIPEGYTTDDYLWTTIFPTNISGDIAYTARSAQYNSGVGYFSLNKDAIAGHATPMTVTDIPDPVTTICIIVQDNYLGEEYNTITITDKNGKSVTFPRNDTHMYYVNGQDLDITQTNADGKLTLSITYDSNNATVSTSATTSSAVEVGKTVNMGTVVPYLLFEDFSSISEGESYGNNDYASSDREQPGNTLDGIGLTGWNAARYWAKPGSVRINFRRQKVLGFGSSHHGRLDTPSLSKLKNSVNVLVQFDAGAHHHSQSSSTINASYINLATHTNSANPIDGIPTGKSGMFSSYSTTINDFGTTHYKSGNLGNNFSDNAFTISFPTHSKTISVTPSTRLCFYPTADISDAAIGNAEVNIYIDNIRVSIAK